MAHISMKGLLEAGVHFGHQTRRWNPKMNQYIFAARNNIHIIDLAQTARMFDTAYEYVRELSSQGKTILMVGTKKQAQETVAEQAARCGMFYVNQRWLGGMLTNFQTIQGRLRHLASLEAQRDNGELAVLPKREGLKIEAEIAKLNKMLGGVKGMRRLPSAIFIVDTHKEQLAVAEAVRLQIPIVALVDTNADPDNIDFPIPANDDAIRAVRLICERIADAVVEGRTMRVSAMADAEEGASDSELEELPMSFAPEDANVNAVNPEAASGAEPVSSNDAPAPVLEAVTE